VRTGASRTDVDTRITVAAVDTRITVAADDVESAATPPSTPQAALEKAPL
jgi:hypothetical protein